MTQSDSPGRPPLRRAAAFLGHRAREALLIPAVLLRRARPRLLFLPSSGREGASLLRAHNIAQALTRRGWSCVTAPAQLEQVQRRRLLRAFAPDLVVLQQCRHPFNSHEHLDGRPFVLDIDDADFYDPKMTDRLEENCRRARGVIAGSRFIRRWCAERNPTVAVVWTGTPVSRGPRPTHARRGPVIAWAQSAPLGYRAELDFVRALHGRLRAAGLEFRLRLYGLNDEAARREAREVFDGDPALELLGTLPYAVFIRSLRDVAVGLSPVVYDSPFSRGKSFGKILGYLDAMTPVVASDEADHALFFTPESGVISNDAETWTTACVALLRDPACRQAMAERAFADFRRRLSTEAAADQVERFLRRIL